MLRLTLTSMEAIGFTVQHFVTLFWKVLYKLIDWLKPLFILDKSIEVPLICNADEITYNKLKWHVESTSRTTIKTEEQ